MHLGGSEHPTDIYPGQTKRLPAIFTMGGEEPQLRITWSENGDEKSENFYVN
jgi:hypothetical protein